MFKELKEIVMNEIKRIEADLIAAHADKEDRLPSLVGQLERMVTLGSNFEMAEEELVIKNKSLEAQIKAMNN